MRWPASKSVRPSRVSVSDVLSKIVLLFLAGIALLGMFGKLRLPGRARLQSARCPSCGKFRIGKSCPCRKGPA